MKIGELAERTGVSTRLLRYYEEQDLLHPERQGNGYRSYLPDDVARVERIRGLLESGLPTRVIHRIMPCSNEITDPTLLTALQEEVAAIDRRITCLTEHRDAIRRYLDDNLRDAAVPTGSPEPI